VILLHGTHDTVTPYANAKLIYDRAQSVGLPSTLITVEGKGHGIWKEVEEKYMDDMTTSIYD